MDAPLMPLIPGTPDFAGATTTLGTLAAKHATLVVDFWTSACPACPRALTKLQNFATKITDPTIKCVSVCLGREAGQAKIIVEEGEWADVDHFYVDAGAREAIVDTWNFSHVPFFVVLENGKTKYADSPPKAIDDVVTQAP